jgi:[CysO sulfur-carrier protein]-S-L-cysteine hydrolase
MDGRNYFVDHTMTFLEIPIAVLPDIIASLDKVFPQEGCGILAGKHNRVEQVISITNVLHLPTRYLMDANEQLNAFISIDEKDLDILAIYHSHPSGGSVPSQTDIDEFRYPNVVTLIASKLESKWIFAGYLIDDHQYEEISIKWIE